MTLYQFFCVVPALLLLITALARLNDIGKAQRSKRWWARRLGLLMVFVGMTIFIAAHFFTFAPYWRQVMALLSLWGFTLTWMTTPGMPPWWKYISRNDAPDTGMRRRAGDV